MDATFLQTQIDETQAIITAYNSVILKIAAGAAQSYTLDTGQDRQTVTKLDLPSLIKTRDSLLNSCVTLEARLNGSGSVTAVPAW